PHIGRPSRRCATSAGSCRRSPRWSTPAASTPATTCGCSRVATRCGWSSKERCGGAPSSDRNAAMRSARLDYADPEHPVSLSEVDDPVLPRGDWARVEVRAGGICGSDLHAIFPDGSGTPTFLPLVGFPMEMGHELGGVITEA